MCRRLSARGGSRPLSGTHSDSSNACDRHWPAISGADSVWGRLPDSTATRNVPYQVEERYRGSTALKIGVLTFCRPIETTQHIPVCRRLSVRGGPNPLSGAAVGPSCRPFVTVPRSGPPTAAPPRSTDGVVSGPPNRTPPTRPRRPIGGGFVCRTCRAERAGPSRRWAPSPSTRYAFIVARERSTRASGRNPRSEANRTMSMRVWIPSLFLMFSRCFSTVRGLMARCSPTSWLV